MVIFRNRFGRSPGQASDDGALVHRSLIPPAISQVGGKILSISALCAALVLVLTPLATAYAAGDPATGSSDWTSTATAYGCTGCHGTPQPTASASTGAFSGMGSTVYALSVYANNGANVAGAANPGYSPIPAGNTWGCTAGATTATCYMSAKATTLGSSTTPTTAANDIAAYFASLFSPVLNNPGTFTYGSAATVSISITGTYFVTSATAGWSTAFSATGLPAGVSINASTGLISGTTPTVATQTNYSVTVSATNQGNVTAGTKTFTITVNPPPPTVTARSPTSGAITGGTSVIVTGTSFTSASAVKFGATAASFVVNSATQITATAPAASLGTVDITVTNPGGTSATSLSDQYTYLPPVPTVSAISPTSGPAAGGTSVTITGTNFSGSGYTTTAVNFSGTPATSYTVNSATQITATAPAGTAGTAVDITVTNGGGTSATSSADMYTYGTAPTVTGVSPASGPAAGSTSVTITGSNFSGATGVNFGATAAGYTVVSAN